MSAPDLGPPRQATIYRYIARLDKWVKQRFWVRVTADSFAKGGMRECFHVRVDEAILDDEPPRRRKRGAKGPKHPSLKYFPTFDLPLVGKAYSSWERHCTRSTTVAAAASVAATPPAVSRLHFDDIVMQEVVSVLAREFNESLGVADATQLWWHEMKGTVDWTRVNKGATTGSRADHNERRGHRSKLAADKQSRPPSRPSSRPTSRPHSRPTSRPPSISASCAFSTQVKTRSVPPSPRAQAQVDAVLENNTPVRFLPVWLMALVRDACSLSTHEFGNLFNLEPLVTGEYSKFSDNSGKVYTGKDKTSSLISHAFSHWSFVHTGYQLMVTDLQGVHRLFTDPQVHTRSALGFGIGNLGPRGIESFFASHKCNDLCHALALEPFRVTEALQERMREAERAELVVRKRRLAKQLTVARVNAQKRTAARNDVRTTAQSNKQSAASDSSSDDNTATTLAARSIVTPSRSLVETDCQELLKTTAKWLIDAAEVWSEPRTSGGTDPSGQVCLSRWKTSEAATKK